MCQRPQPRGQVLDNSIHEAIARGREGLLRRQRADVTMDGTQAERWRLERQAFDELLESGRETRVPGAARALAQETRQACCPIALSPAGQRPEWQLLLACNLGQRDTVMKEGTEDLEACDGLRTGLVSQCRQWCCQAWGR